MNEIKVCEYVLLFATRYALGRTTVAPAIVVRNIINNWDKLEEFTKKEIKEEIQETINNQKAEMKFHVKEWQKVLDLK